MKDKVFNSKILLFGEYSILKNSKGLSIPFPLFNGSLKTPLEKTELSKKSNSTLLDFFKYLKSIAELDFHSFKIDLENGIYFDSSIPVGYGVGSSGAIVAAVYEKYAQNKIVLSKEISNEKLLNLKEIFSKMESFFHGKSSGLDPLNIYLGKPILINSINEIEVTKIPDGKKNKKIAVFLLDSGRSSSTAAMIKIFKSKMKNEVFKKMLSKEFIKYTNECIDNFLIADTNNLLENIKELSKIVLKNFKPMIPHSIQDVWEQGISKDSYFLKLCGSGGGGYILGFTPNFEKAKQELSHYNLTPVYFM